MAKKQFTIVKLAPNVSSWCDKDNNIYLSMSKRTSKRIKENCDMTMINKGVKAGLIILEVHCEEIPEPVKQVKAAAIPEEPVVEEVKKAPTRSRAKKKEDVKIEVNIIEDNSKEE